LDDALVIGGGPVGSRVAFGLAGVGAKVVVLEQKENLGEPVCCTGIISEECVSTFGIDQDVILRRMNSARIFSPSGRMLRLWREEPQACIVDRPAFNVALARRAQVRGVGYVTGSQVRKLEVGGDGVRAEVVDRKGKSRVFQARIAVITTGFGSRMVEGVGFGKVRDSVGGAQAEVETSGVEEVEVYMGQEIAPAFFAWLVPTSPQRALVGLLSRRRPGDYLKRLLSSLVSQDKIVSDEVELSYGAIPLRPLARSFSDRMVVVGTAAGQVKPTTGGGIYYGLLCADIAVSNLKRALENDTLSARDLAGYERDWKKLLGRELRIGYWARRFYQLLSDRQVDGVFDITKSAGIDQALLAADDLSFDWHSPVVLKLVGNQAFSKVFKAINLPFPLKGRGLKS